MPENLDDDSSLAAIPEIVTPELLTPSVEHAGVKLSVKPSSDNLPLSEVSAAIPVAQMGEPTAKPEIGYSIKSIDYSRSSVVRTGWNYFYFFIFLILALPAMLIFVFILRHL